MVSDQRWHISRHRKVEKALKDLPDDIQEIYYFLEQDLKYKGPIQTGWKNYGKLVKGKNKEMYHCHLKKGRPTYVACWEIIDKTIRILEVYYVGTHEKAPY